jgi:hypothetical protein
MMKLTIETENTTREAFIKGAYEKAMIESNLDNFIKSLNNNLGYCKIGKGGSHIWISDDQTNERLAIITNLFN